MAQRRDPHLWPRARDAIMFLLGATGFVHELLTTGVERPYILTACLALMGLPLMLGGKQPPEE